MGVDKYLEEEIVRQLKDPERRREAFEQLVRAYSEQLYWQIRRMVISHDDANDILQNTLIKVWTNIHLFRNDSKLSTWLYRITANETLAFLSNQKKMQGISIDEVDDSLLNKLETPEFFSGDRAQKELQTAILMLPDKQRLVFNMRYFQELGYEEMAEILGTSVGALKASYHYAVKKITNYLKDGD